MKKLLLLILPFLFVAIAHGADYEYIDAWNRIAYYYKWEENPLLNTKCWEAIVRVKEIYNWSTWWPYVDWKVDPVSCVSKEVYLEMKDIEYKKMMKEKVLQSMSWSISLDQSIEESKKAIEEKLKLQNEMNKPVEVKLTLKEKNALQLKAIREKRKKK